MFYSTPMAPKGERDLNFYDFDDTVYGNEVRNINFWLTQRVYYSYPKYFRRSIPHIGFLEQIQGLRGI